MFGKIGRITPASSGSNALRGDQLGGLIFSGGDYEDTTLGGKMFFGYSAGQNVALFSATAAIGLIIVNPLTSGVNMVIYKWAAQIWATSATMTGLVLAVSTNPLGVTTYAAATLSGRTLIAGSSGLPSGGCYACISATVVAPVIVWPLMHNTAAINTVGAEVIGGDLQGSFAFAPGTAAVFGALGAAGVTVNLAATWKEVPVGL